MTTKTNGAKTTPKDPILKDEGMWTFDNPPLHLLKRYYKFTPTKKWLDHVRLSALRFNDGGSGSFVSKDGLVLTNHHVAMGQLQKMSSQKNNYVRDGFFAKSKAKEVKAPDLEINQLVGLVNVTARIQKAIPAGANDKRASDARKAAIAQIEKESKDKTGLRSDVVELYNGGEFWLYRYKKYTDIRLVMAPEAQTAFFGGDEDNFTYPRYCLDYAFFRVYENGKPAKPKNFLKWSKQGAQEQDLTFVIGHPGSTDRLMTVAQLRYQKDIAIPKRLEMYRQRKAALEAYGAKSKENKRQAQDYLFGIENALKVVTGEWESLCEGEILQQKAAAEQKMRTDVERNPRLRKMAHGAWDRLERLQAEVRTKHLELTFRRLSGYNLPGIADTLVRYVVEIEKPNAKRYEEFRDSGLDSLKHQLFSPAPIYPALEEALLTCGLQEALDKLGKNDPFIRAALKGKSPAEVARRAVRGTRLANIDFRKKLLAGGRKAIAKCMDPMIRLSLACDAIYRSQRKWYEDRIEATAQAQGDRIARARFALYGKKVYPDATFTLRFAYGRPLGYDWDKTKVPFKTTFHGIYDRGLSFDNKHPYTLPKKVAQAHKKLKLDTPLNFVSTHDITGGNSGSPVVDRKGHLVGLIFDGNVQSMGTSYAYTLESSRAVSVHSSAITESLRNIYGMSGLAKEITG
jgi:hypothetical protein